MASQTGPVTPSAHVVGNMFIEQYYPILRHQPEELHKFYLDSSVLSRPDADGVMTSVTTMKAIDEKVMSLDYKSYTVEIKTVDAQHSYKDGVIVLVTGCFIGKDNLRQNFTQSFFLAPQENGGYFVLNDVFRFVEDIHPDELDETPVDDAEDTAAVASSSAEPAADHDDHVPPLATVSEEQKISDEFHEPTPKKGVSVEEVVDVAAAPSEIASSPAPEVAIPASQEDAPKKSYASIVKVMKGPPISASPVKVQTSVTKSHISSVNTEKQSVAPATAAATAAPLEVPITDSNHASESSSPPEDVEGYSVYVRNLPLNATPSQLEGEFKKFGPIKPSGVQVRNHKQHGYCFGFVEFESLSSMRSAIEASPVTIAGWQAVVEEKRTTTRVTGGTNNIGNARGRFVPVRGGFRNDNFRGRGGYNGPQGYGRSEFRSRGEFPSSRGRGAAGRTESYQRVGRPNVIQAAVSAA